jgi:hypothetical protein
MRSLQTNPNFRRTPCPPLNPRVVLLARCDGYSIREAADTLDDLCFGDIAMITLR